jgi:hypothetical protein
VTGGLVRHDRGCSLMVTRGRKPCDCSTSAKKTAPPVSMAQAVIMALDDGMLGGLSHKAGTAAG